MKTISPLRTLFCLLLVSLTARAQESAGIPGSVDLPEVRVWASTWKTSEPCPTCRVIPGVLTFARSEPGKESLTVYYRTDGTAAPGLDYVALPGHVEIPAGETSVEVVVAPLDDLLAEGPEVVRVRLVASPTGDGYRIPEHPGEALVVIGDDEPDAPAARLDIIEPADGLTLGTPAIVPVAAIVVWSEGEIDQPVEFFAGDRLIGRSPGLPYMRPMMIPCLPSVQRVLWTNPPAGEHVLTARAPVPPDWKVESPPTRVRVVEGPVPPVVGIEATSPIAEETSFPFRRLRYDGRLTISRTGPTDYSLPVFLHYSGTATIPDDFESPPPWLVSIPAGASSVDVPIEAFRDEIPEGIETLVATLSNCPPDTDPPMGIPCFGFDIDPARSRATIFLRDDGITQASMDITHPHDGDHFRRGATIPIEATAIDLEGYISRVEFFDGERRIGVSEIFFVRAPDPGTPIQHQFEWSGAELGEHVITARAVLSDSLSVTSAPVRISVAGEENLPPRIEVVRPEPGAVFPPSTDIEIVAVAWDPDGVVRRVLFFANGQRIGEVGLLPGAEAEPGESQRFIFVWRHAEPGEHQLTARALDNEGTGADSDPVGIRVGEPTEVTLVTVVARDPFAVEPQASGEANIATFLLRRWGGGDGELAVRYSLRGTAENGVDYALLSGRARFLAGQRSVLVVVEPLRDEESEGVETVLLRLEPGEAGIGEAAYVIGRRGRAVALIRDKPWIQPPDRGLCHPLPGGFAHVCFPALDGEHYRFEASLDLCCWERVFEATSQGEAVHFIDEESDQMRWRYYRAIWEPVGIVAP